MEVTGCVDSAAGRREFLRRLEERVDWGRPAKAEAEYSEGEGQPKLAVHSALRRGWMFGSQEFKEKLLETVSAVLDRGQKKRADGYHGSEVRAHGERRARALAVAGRVYFLREQISLEGLAKTDGRKGVIAELIQRETTAKLDWISRELNMGDRSTCSRTISQTRGRLARERKWKAMQKEIAEISINND